MALCHNSKDPRKELIAHSRALRCLGLTVPDVLDVLQIINKVRLQKRLTIPHRYLSWLLYFLIFAQHCHPFQSSSPHRCQTARYTLTHIFGKQISQTYLERCLFRFLQTFSSTISRLQTLHCRLFCGLRPDFLTNINFHGIN